MTTEQTTQNATTFAGLGIDTDLVEELDSQGITSPFPIQAGRA